MPCNDQDGNDKIPPQEIPNNDKILSGEKQGDDQTPPDFRQEDDQIPFEDQKSVGYIPPCCKIPYSEICPFEGTRNIPLFNERSYGSQFLSVS